MRKQDFAPAAATGNPLAATLALGDKRDVGVLAGGMSNRWVEGQMALGMPHLKIGPRRARFDLAEVREWLRARYAVQRRGAARPPAAQAATPGGVAQ
jgi:hypothetical protein